MATLVFQAVGTALGSVFGPVGAAIGSAIGAMGGYAVDTAIINSTRHYEGPRLGNARPMSADEGASLPFVYGTVRLTGNLIWATRFIERKTTERQGGKGGPKVTTYSYYIHAAFALAQGDVAAVRRVWADGQELDMNTVNMRFYSGSETQMPDPLIEAKQGQGNAPAYRGTAYVVFENLPLDNYGNRLPQLQFEIIRITGELTKNIQSVCLLPGATEFGLAPYLVRDEPIAGKRRLINRNSLRGSTDWSAALDELQMLCPNLKNIAIIVPWFGDDLRAEHCRIRPGVMNASVRKPSHDWQVAGLSRGNAHLISYAGETVAYGGTPDDASVVSAIKDAKKRGLKVTLYPFIMMDIPADNQKISPYGEATQPPYPWRGRITCHPAPLQTASVDKTAVAGQQISHFVEQEWGYRRFLKHYASLAVQAGGVNAFLLGSELIGLTKVRDTPTNFPFVNALCSLASEIRTQLGENTLLTYAADWSEYFGYHPADGTGDVFFHLDPLWAHPAINAVGIDNYMPLGDWRDEDITGGNPDGFTTSTDLLGMQDHINSGEGFDWYYLDDKARKQRERSIISDGLANKPWVYRYKDIKSWWSNPHYNRINGAELKQPTAWIVQSKPIWLTELGCPAVDKGANQPNIFPDMKSSEGGMPYFSSGDRNDLIQNRFLRAHFKHWTDHEENNPISDLYNGQMLDTERIYLWAWDTRPYPEFPLYSGIWGDAANWFTGHWLNGRLNGVALDELLTQILDDYDMDKADTSGADGFVAGFIIPDPVSIRAVIEPLLDIFGVIAFEDNGRLIYQSLSRAQKSMILSDDLVVPEDSGSSNATLITTLEDYKDKAQQVTLFYQNALNEFQSASVIKSRETGLGSHSLSLSGAMDEGQATELAEKWMGRHWEERRKISFSLPWSHAAFNVGDRVKLPVLQGERDYLVLSIADGEMRAIDAVALTKEIIGGAGSAINPSLPSPELDVKPVFQLMDLPLWPGAEVAHEQMRIACFSSHWLGGSLYASSGANDLHFRTYVAERAVMGELLTPLIPMPSGRICHNQAVDVQIYGGELSSCDWGRLFNGANSAALRGHDGQWEVFQFQSADEISAGIWRLTNLIRGQLGTDAISRQTISVNSPFVLLNDAVVSCGLRSSEIGAELNWYIGAGGYPISEDYFETVSASGGLAAIRPLSPVHLRPNKMANGGIKLTWIRRGRVDADQWQYSDIPLGETTEVYNIIIRQQHTVLLERNVITSDYLLDASLVNGWKSEGIAEVEFSVAQISERCGPGTYLQQNITL